MESDYFGSKSSGSDRKSISSLRETKRHMERTINLDRIVPFDVEGQAAGNRSVLTSTNFEQFIPFSQISF